MRKLIFLAILLALFAGCGTTGYVVQDTTITKEEAQYSTLITGYMIDAVKIISSNEHIEDIDHGDLSQMQQLRIKIYALDVPEQYRKAQKRTELGFDHFVSAMEYAIKAKNVYDNSPDVKKLDNVYTATEISIEVDQYIAFLDLYQESLEKGKIEHVEAFKLL